MCVHVHPTLYQQYSGREVKPPIWCMLSLSQGLWTESPFINFLCKEIVLIPFVSYFQMVAIHYTVMSLLFHRWLPVYLSLAG